MISGPKGDVQHTGHIGVDGAFFGDVAFAAGEIGAKGTSKGTATLTGGHHNRRPVSHQPGSSTTLPFASMPSLIR